MIKRQGGTARVVVVTNMVTPYTDRLYNALVASGLDISIVACVSREPNRRWEIDRSTYPLAVLSGWVLKLGTGRYAHISRGLGKVLSRLKPDLVFINGFYPTMVFAAFWARFRGVKLALTIDGWAETMPQTAYHRLVRPFVLGWCRVVVTPGDKGRLFFRAQGVPDERIVQVPLVPAWEPPQQIRGFAERTYDVLWASRINNMQKNIFFFISVLEEIQKTRPDVKVRVLGTGEDERIALERLGLTGLSYDHDPYVAWEQMADVYNSAKVLLLPSVWEPWGLVCDEALICGTPCIVSPHVGAADDAVRSGENGEVLALLVRDWAAATLKVISDQQTWEAYSAKARSLQLERSTPRSAAAFRQAVERALTD